MYDESTFVKYDVSYYAATNISGIVAKSATIAFTNSTLRLLLQIAEKGWKQTCFDVTLLKATVSIYHSKLTCFLVAISWELPFNEINLLIT